MIRTCTRAVVRPLNPGARCGGSGGVGCTGSRGGVSGGVKRTGGEVVTTGGHSNDEVICLRGGDGAGGNSG